MLLELRISNFALIEKQAISFGPGLNVISGETGAGKSIVLQALELLLGGRAKAQIIRSGSDSCEIEALFDLQSLNPGIRAELPDIVEGDELLLSRLISRGGRSKVYINGRLGTLSLLEEISRCLVNICGQSQHVRLLEAQYHLELIDQYGGHQNLLDDYQKKFLAWQECKKKLETVEEKLKNSVLRKAELELIISELQPLGITAGVRAELETKVKVLANAEALLKTGQAVLDGLTDSQGLLSQIEALGRLLGEMQRLDPKTAELQEAFQRASTELEEFERDLNSYLSRLEINDQELENFRERLAEIARLERRYRTNDAGLVELLREAKEEMELLSEGESVENLRKETEELLAAAAAAAVKLTKARTKAGKLFSKTVQEELAELNMADSKVRVEMTKKDFSKTGQDSLEFLISPNPGEPPQALRRIASGGELSRIMLVLKNILQDRTGVNVLAFDEVDAGVSGSVARAVGKKLKKLAGYSQVLCITHLAQVASLSDSHFLVEKETGDRTTTLIRELGEQEKVDEVARMLAGYKITAASRESARELISSEI